MLIFAGTLEKHILDTFVYEPLSFFRFVDVKINVNDTQVYDIIVNFISW
jgi:hypothetical protein